MKPQNFAIGTVRFALALLGFVLAGWVAFIEFIAPWLERSDASSDKAGDA